MITVNTPNVTTALAWGIDQFKQFEQNKGCIVESRNGSTIEAPTPVVTTLYHPRERVLFSPSRDANPFFHFFEALWMLEGRNDLQFPLMFNKQFAAYSDDGFRVWGAYGYRWRAFFRFDQLYHIIHLLRRDPNTRRAVLQMWAPYGDLIPDGRNGGLGSKDVPCNTNIYFKVRHGALHMTVCNRSNDMLWGAYGANAVHMSMMMEYVADMVGLPMGLMRTMSDSLHVYLNDKGGELWNRVKAAPKEDLKNFYYAGEVTTFPMNAGELRWHDDLRVFMTKATAVGDTDHTDYHTQFFKRVVTPMWRAWRYRSQDEARICAAPDWRKAASEWLARRA